MEIFPNVVHFKVAMYLSAFVGLWPHISTRNKKIYFAYRIMSKLYYIYFRVFIFTQCIQLTLLLIADEVNYQEVTNNLGITLVYMNSAVRCKVCKGKVIKKIINEVSKFENYLRNSLDTDIVNIYNRNVKRNSIFCILFATNTMLISLVYTVWPFFVEKPTVEINNTTVEVKFLPVSAWVPFDVQKHYVTAYVLLLFNANYMGTMFFISTETLAFGLMTYPLGKILILKHILSNFNKYKGLMQRKMKIASEELSKAQLRECIVKHQDIIRYIDEFNAEMKHTYLLDFLQCSLQLTCILYRFLNQRNFALVLINLQFLLAMLIRLFITYWTANEIILESESISVELYNMEWLEEDAKVNKMILFMMVRAQKPLQLFIGAFKVMSLQTFITIMKVTYSYISLFYRK